MRAVVAGAGPIGLATAILLARDGWQMRVYDKDPQEPPESPDELWSNWDRPGVAQFRMPHIMMPRFRHLLDAELPAVRDRLERLGARRFNLTEGLPQTLSDRSPRPEDKRFETLTARRPIVEAAFAQVAADTPGVEIVRGVGVEGLLAASAKGRDPSTPHVTGVLTSTGERVTADLVVDGLGRRSPLPRWVAGLGGRPPLEEASDAGFAYYARHFRSRDGAVPEYRGPIGGPAGTLLTLTIVGDNACWTVALTPTAGDAPLKALRHAEVWDRVANSIPHVAPWLDGEPLGGVLPMAGGLDPLSPVGGRGAARRHRALSRSATPGPAPTRAVCREDRSAPCPGREHPGPDRSAMDGSGPERPRPRVLRERGVRGCLRDSRRLARRSGSHPAG